MAQTTTNKKSTQGQIKSLIGNGKTVEVNLVRFIQDFGKDGLYIDEDMCMDPAVYLEMTVKGKSLGSCCVLTTIEAHIDTFLSDYSKIQASGFSMRKVITDLVNYHEQALQKKISGHTATLIYTMECTVSDSSVSMSDIMDAMAGREVEKKPPVYTIEGIGLVLEDRLCDILGIKRGEVFYEFSIPWLLLQEVFG